MDPKKISERLIKFNNDHSLGGDSYNENNKAQVSNKILHIREKNNLQLRKNKLDQDIMKNRLNSLARNKGDRKYLDLEIKRSDPDLINFIPEEIEIEFDSYDEKEELIKQYISNYIEYEESCITTNPSAIFPKNISSLQNFIPNSSLYHLHDKNYSNPEKVYIFLAYAKFAIWKLKDITILWENINDEGIFFDSNLFEMLIKILSFTTDHKIQYEILWILINLTCDSREYTENMIETEILENLFKFTSSKEPGIIYHIIWLFFNLLENEELCHIIIKTIPDFLNRINILIKVYSNTYQFQDIFNKLCWVVYRIFAHTGDSYIEIFFVSLPIFLKVLENEVDVVILKLDIDCRSSSSQSNCDIINCILLLFDKLTRYIEDAEIISKLINSSLMTSIMKLLSRSLEDMQIEKDYDDVYLIFRVVGGLMTSDNDSDVDYLLNNFNFFETVELILKNSNFSLDTNPNTAKKILKEIAWCMSNITGGSKNHVDRVLKSPIPLLLTNFAKDFKESKYIKEVLFMFYNAFDYGSNEAKNTMLSEQVLDIICEAIMNSNYTSEVSKIALDFLRLIINEVKCMLDMNIYPTIKKKLEVYNIPNYLEQLQYNKNQGIAEVAEFIFLDNWSCFEDY